MDIPYDDDQLKGSQIWGASDDFVEFRGDIYGEVGHFDTDDEALGLLVALSDGSILRIQYGLKVPDVWGIVVLHKGDCFEKLEECSDPDADVYSDIAVFKPGLSWAYAGTDMFKVD